MYELILLLLGFILGFFVKSHLNKSQPQQKKQSYYRPLTHQ